MHKILVIRFSSIGDIVLTSPVIRCLKAQLPFTEIHFLTKEEYHPLLVANPYIDKIHLMEDGLSTLIPKLKAEHFNYIIDLHHNLRTLKLKARLGLKIHSFPKLNIEKWMMVNFKINNLPKEHIVDRYFKTFPRQTSFMGMRRGFVRTETLLYGRDFGDMTGNLYLNIRSAKFEYSTDSILFAAQKRNLYHF